MTGNSEKIILKTERLVIFPLSNMETLNLIQDVDDDEAIDAYIDMLKGSLHYPKHRIWYTPWGVALAEKPDEIIGDLCFKGPQKGGAVEIGYGIKSQYEGNGYTTEAVKTLIEWAFSQYCVFRVYAETLPDNKASQKILKKIGFKSCHTKGSEGPIYVCINPKADYSKLKDVFDVAVCTEEDAKEICKWKYKGKYSVYNFSPWETVCANGWDLANDEIRESNYVSVRMDGKLFGFYNIRKTEETIEIGVGMRPDMCGKHYGESFMRLAVNTVSECYPGISIILKVRTFNKRAVKCYENCGFEIVSQYYDDKAITPDEMYVMELKH